MADDEQQPAWRNVYSSHVDKGMWRPDNGGELLIRWDSGKTSIYSGVPQQLAEQTLQSWSVGKALRDIKSGGFAHRYATKDDGLLGTLSMRER